MKGFDNIKILICLNEKDYWNFNIYTLFNLYRRQYICMTVIYVILITLLYVIQLTILASCLLVGITFGILFGYISLKRRLKQFAQQPGFIGEHSIEIKQEGIFEKTDVNEGFHNWKAITSIKENKKYVFLYIGLIGAHVIPKSAFANS